MIQGKWLSAIVLRRSCWCGCPSAWESEERFWTWRWWCHYRKLQPGGTDLVRWYWIYFFVKQNRISYSCSFAAIFPCPPLTWKGNVLSLPTLRPTLCLFLRLSSAAPLSHSPSPPFHTEAIISPARVSRLASSTLGLTPPLVGEAVDGWRPCGAGLLLGLRFYRGLGAIHISDEQEREEIRS